MEGIGYLKIAAKDGAMEAGVMMWNNDDFNATQLYQLDTDVTKAVAEATETLNVKLAEVVAKTDVELTINDPVAKTEEGKPVRIIRNAETNLGDLCADAYRYRFRRGHRLRQRRRHPCQHQGGRYYPERHPEGASLRQCAVRGARPPASRFWTRWSSAPSDVPGEIWRLPAGVRPDL